ncbi:MAG: PAS domain S-box protein [Candidatus Liberibacter ctenarytainae]|uniref:histidine kinase n=1 Tax=Candidatus Liberibacter ctenarytainae TaxID=2020335 RepID=A0A937ACH7_9HYPH|nr:PAS domain S-box protein [Candidatus Liberibacter ctenarytainae]
MENVENIISYRDLYSSRIWQKLTIWFKRMFETKTSPISSPALSLNHTISMISILCLMLVAISSAIKVTSNYSQKDRAAIEEILLLAHSVKTILNTTHINLVLERQGEIQSILKNILPDRKYFPEKFILISQSNGLIIASSAENTLHVGKKISDIIMDPHLLKSIGNTTQTAEVFLAHTPYYVSLVHLAENNGLVLVASSQLPLLRYWRDEVTTGVVLFSGVSTIFLFILFNHYKQAKRAKETDDILLEANICIETALSRGRCGIWSFNFVGKKFHLSQSMYEILGIPYSDKALSLMQVIRLIYTDGQEVHNIIRSVAKGKSTQLDQIFRIRHATGTPIWIKVRAQVMRTTSGGMSIIGIAMDITEQHNLERRYVETDQRLAKAIECTSEAVVLWDKNDQLVMCNFRYQQAYKLPDKVLVPGTKRSVIKDSGTHPSLEYYTSDPEDSRTITKEIKLADSRWLQINEWRTHDGGTISVGTDITQLKHNQKKLHESERRLMATINDLSTSRQILERQKNELLIANLKYQTEKERAEIANRAKSEFLAKMSHELRTPLNAILGFSEIIKGEVLGPLGSAKHHEYAQDIHDSGTHLLGMINDILEISKIEADHIHINKKIIDLASVMQESIHRISIPARNKNITIEKQVSQKLLFNADTRIIEQILTHILSNAIKFTQENGKIIIRVSKIGRYLLITILDNGIGIPQSALEKVEKPFEQLKNCYVQNKGGPRLGLTISYALTNLHGGKLKILSQEGRGTTVMICMPI